MNQESLGNSQDLQRAQERRTGRATPKKLPPVPPEEQCNGSCELHWKPSKTKRS